MLSFQIKGFSFSHSIFKDNIQLVILLSPQTEIIFFKNVLKLFSENKITKIHRLIICFAFKKQNSV